MNMNELPARERAHLHLAELRAIVGGERDPFGAAWDHDMSGEERQFWCRAAGLGGYAWAYASRLWADIDGTNRTKIKQAVRKIAGRAALLLNDKIGGAQASVAS